MGQETKRGRHGSVGRPRGAQSSSPQHAGGLACISNVSEPESVRDPPTETQGTAAAAKALARWENEGGRVLAADPRPRG